MCGGGETRRRRDLKDSKDDNVSKLDLWYIDVCVWGGGGRRRDLKDSTDYNVSKLDTAWSSCFQPTAVRVVGGGGGWLGWGMWAVQELGTQKYVSYFLTRLSTMLVTL